MTPSVNAMPTPVVPNSIAGGASRTAISSFSASPLGSNRIRAVESTVPVTLMTRLATVDLGYRWPVCPVPAPKAGDAGGLGPTSADCPGLPRGLPRTGGWSSALGAGGAGALAGLGGLLAVATLAGLAGWRRRRSGGEGRR
jgi:hypothetical protein